MTLKIKEESTKPPCVPHNTSQPLPEQIVQASDDSSFIIREIQPSQLQISNVASLRAAPKCNRILKSKVQKLSQKSPQNLLQKTKLIANNKGAIKISQHQLNLMKKISDFGHKCPYCPNHFIEESFVTEHVRQKHTFVCSVCESIFPFKISLITHQNNTHGGPTGSGSANTTQIHYGCPICGWKFITKKMMQKHMIEKHRVMMKIDDNDGVRRKLIQILIIKLFFLILETRNF